MGQLKLAKNKGAIDAEMKKIEKCSLLILDDLFRKVNPYGNNRRQTRIKINHNNITTSC